jgi:hypothetical protein
MPRQIEASRHKAAPTKSKGPNLFEHETRERGSIRLNREWTRIDANPIAANELIFGRDARPSRPDWRQGALSPTRRSDWRILFNHEWTRRDTNRDPQTNDRPTGGALLLGRSIGWLNRTE